SVENNFEKKSVLQYLVRKPKVASEKPPLIILLHGVGSNEEDLFSFAENLPGKFLVISARAPHVLSPGSYAWYHVDLSTGKRNINVEEAELTRKLLIRFIEDLKNELSFDENQVYLCGFS